MDNDINIGGFEVTGLDEISRKIDQLNLKNPDMEKRVTDIIRDAIKIARGIVSQGAKSAMPNDPRDTYKAVKYMVYKSVLGGNVSILYKRSSSKRKSNYEPPRKLQPGQRGGNRVPRGERTQKMMDYYGTDRGFVLRFLNSGTGVRNAGTRGGRLNGKRGRIGARNWFEPAGQQGMSQAVRMIEQEIDRLVAEEFGR